MKMPTLWQIDLIPWYVFAAYWLIAWLHVKRTKATETFALRLTTILPMVLGFELLFSRSLAIGPLRLRFVPAETWIGWSGIALTSVGVAIAIWARYLHRPVLEFPSHSQRGASPHSLGSVRACSAPDLHRDAAGGDRHGPGDRRVARDSGRRSDLGGAFP
jgi:hypothetical protein